MSLEKVKIGLKIDPQDWACIKAEAKARDVDPAVLLREIIGEYTRSRFVAYREAHRLLSHQGLEGVLRGPGARFAMAGGDDDNLIVLEGEA